MKSREVRFFEILLIERTYYFNALQLYIISADFCLLQPFETEISAPYFPFCNGNRRIFKSRSSAALHSNLPIDICFPDSSIVTFIFVLN